MNKSAKLIISILTALLFSHSLFAEPIWIDVRTLEEYNTDHISGDMNMPLQQLSPDGLAEVYGKDADIRLYCRSGGRAGQAQKILQDAGFSNVSNAGGIEDVRKLRSIAPSPKAADQGQDQSNH